MKNSKILLVGNINTPFIKQLYDYIIVGNYSKVVLINSINDNTIPNDNHYINNKADVYTINNKNSIIKNTIINKIINTINIIRLIINIIDKYGRFDLINFQYFGLYEKLVYLLTNKKTNRVLITYWGTDLLNKRNIVSYLVDMLVITNNNYYSFISESLKKRFVNNYPQIEERKLFYTYFGDPVINEIDALISKGNIKKKNIINITIGYNGDMRHRHKDVIVALKKLKNKDNYKIIIPMTYSFSENYSILIEKELKNTGIKYEIIKKYLSYKEMANLIVKTDIFIHNQITDALSNTVCEHVYANNYILNTRDIFYQEFEDAKISINYFSNVNEIPELIDSYSKKATINNKDKIRKYISWDELTIQWANAFGI